VSKASRSKGVKCLSYVLQKWLQRWMLGRNLFQALEYRRFGICRRSSFNVLKSTVRQLPGGKPANPSSHSVLQISTSSYCPFARSYVYFVLCMARILVMVQDQLMIVNKILMPERLSSRPGGIHTHIYLYRPASCTPSPSHSVLHVVERGLGT
jgi:hypothetical protein